MQFWLTVGGLFWKGPWMLLSKCSRWDAICTNHVLNSEEGPGVSVVKPLCETGCSNQLCWNPSRPPCCCALFLLGLNSKGVHTQVRPMKQDLLANRGGFNSMDVNNQFYSTTGLFTTIYFVSTELQKITTTPLGFNIWTQITHLQFFF